MCITSFGCFVTLFKKLVGKVQKFAASNQMNGKVKNIILK